MKGTPEEEEAQEIFDSWVNLTSKATGAIHSKVPELSNLKLTVLDFESSLTTDFHKAPGYTGSEKLTQRLTSLIDENKAKPDSASIAVSHGFVPNFVQLYRAQFGKTEVDKPIKVADFFGRETPSVIPFPKEEIDHDIRRISEWDAPDPSRIKRLEDLRGRKREFEGYEDSQRAEMATDYVHKNLAYGVGGWELSENRWVEGPDEHPLANIERYAHSPHAIEFTQDKSYAQGVVEDGGGVLVEENAPEGRVLNSIMGLRKIFKGIQKETWQHINGCRMWLEVERSTITHEITSVKPCHKNLQKVIDN